MSEVRANTISAANGTDPVTLTKQSAAKAWVSFDQNTPEILDSFNTSSLTDTSSGRGDLNWTSAMSNTLYSVPTNSSYVSVSNPYAVTLVDDYTVNNRTASKWYFSNTYSSNAVSSFFDADRGQVSVLGDLA